MSAEAPTAPPPVQKIVRQHTLEKEHKKALERAVTLNIPHAVPTDADEEPSAHKAEESSRGVTTEATSLVEGASTSTDHSTDARANWNEVVEKLFARDEERKLMNKEESSSSTV